MNNEKQNRTPKIQKTIDYFIHCSKRKTLSILYISTSERIGTTQMFLKLSRKHANILDSIKQLVSDTEEICGDL